MAWSEDRRFYLTVRGPFFLLLCCSERAGGHGRRTGARRRIL